MARLQNQAHTIPATYSTSSQLLCQMLRISISHFVLMLMFRAGLDPAACGGSTDTVLGRRWRIMPRVRTILPSVSVASDLEGVGMVAGSGEAGGMDGLINASASSSNSGFFFHRSCAYTPRINGPVFGVQRSVRMSSRPESVGAQEWRRA